MWCCHAAKVEIGQETPGLERKKIKTLEVKDVEEEKKTGADKSIEQIKRTLSLDTAPDWPKKPPSPPQQARPQAAQAGEAAQGETAQFEAAGQAAPPATRPVIEGPRISVSASASVSEVAAATRIQRIFKKRVRKVMARRTALLDTWNELDKKEERELKSNHEEYMQLKKAFDFFAKIDEDVPAEAPAAAKTPTKDSAPSSPFLFRPRGLKFKKKDKDKEKEKEGGKENEKEKEKGEENGTEKENKDVAKETEKEKTEKEQEKKKETVKTKEKEKAKEKEKEDKPESRGKEKDAVKENGKEAEHGAKEKESKKENGEKAENGKPEKGKEGEEEMDGASSKTTDGKKSEETCKATTDSANLVTAKIAATRLLKRIRAKPRIQAKAPPSSDTEGEQAKDGGGASSEATEAKASEEPHTPSVTDSARAAAEHILENIRRRSGGLASGFDANPRITHICSDPRRKKMFKPLRTQLEKAWNEPAEVPNGYDVADLAELSKGVSSGLRRVWNMGLSRVSARHGSMGVSLTVMWVQRMLDEFKQDRILSYRNAVAIISQVYLFLLEEENVVEVAVPQDSKLAIVGDLHGQFEDLLTIFEMNGLPSKNNMYIFNGDFVDRGQNSMECVLTLLALKAIFPHYVFLNRGNHESRDMNSCDGFERECLEKYDATMFDLFSLVFACLPLATVVNKQIFVVHGGLSWRQNLTIEFLQTLDRFHTIFEEQSVQQDLVWSDPDPNMGRHASRRGAGVQFGADVVNEFLTTNSLYMVVRSHECVDRGYEVWFQSKLFTIFSASNYCGNTGNYGSFMTIEGASGRKRIHQFAAVPEVREKINTHVEHLKHMVLGKLIRRISLNVDNLQAYWRTVEVSPGMISRMQWSYGLNRELDLFGVPFLQFTRELGIKHLKVGTNVEYETWLDKYKPVHRKGEGSLSSYLSSEDEESKDEMQLEMADMKEDVKHGHTHANTPYVRDQNGSKDLWKNSEPAAPPVKQESLSDALGRLLFSQQFQLESLFRHFDTDKDGVIDTKEFTDGVHALMKLIGRTYTKEEVDSLMRKVDEDNSGTIDFHEFLRAFGPADPALASTMQSVYSNGNAKKLSSPTTTKLKLLPLNGAESKTPQKVEEESEEKVSKKGSSKNVLRAQDFVTHESTEAGSGTPKKKSPAQQTRERAETSESEKMLYRTRKRAASAGSGYL
eukprot:g57165.t1